MKFAHFTDLHYAAMRASFRKNRISELGLNLLGDMINKIDADTDFIANGGDFIQFEKTFDKSLDKIWMKAVHNTLLNSGFSVVSNIGNYDGERIGGLKEVGKLLDIPHGNYFFDHNDKNGDQHRVIILNQEFQDTPGDQMLFPWSDETLEFVQSALTTSPSQSVTFFSHTPCDDFDWQQANTALHGFNVSNNFRPNSAELRVIMEESGKSILFMAGHTHLETSDAHKNVCYMTVQGMTEATSNGSEVPFARWVNVARDGDHKINIQQHGYKAQSWSWEMKDGSFVKRPYRAPEPQAPTARISGYQSDQPELLLSAE